MAGFGSSAEPCPCGGERYATCCEPFHLGTARPCRTQMEGLTTGGIALPPAGTGLSGGAKASHQPSRPKGRCRASGLIPSRRASNKPAASL